MILHILCVMNEWCVFVFSPTSSYPMPSEHLRCQVDGQGSGYLHGGEAAGYCTANHHWIDIHWARLVTELPTTNFVSA